MAGELFPESGAPTVRVNSLCEKCGKRRMWGEAIFGGYVVCCDVERDWLARAVAANPLGVVYRAPEGGAS